MPVPYAGGSGRTTTTVPRSGLYDTGGSADLGGAASGGSVGGAGGSTILPRTTTVPNPNAIGAAGGGTGTGGQTFGAAATGTPPPTFPTSGYPGSGTEPMRGWASTMGYTPADVMGMNQMPARYLYDIVGQRGMDPTGGLFYMMEPLADVMMPLYELMYGGGTGMTQGFDPNNIANFMGQMFGSMMTPGGRGVNPGELWQNMLNPGGDQSILNNYLNTGTPEEQVENLRRYAMMIGQLSGSPMYQQALSNYLSSQGYDYLNAFQGGQQPAYTFGNQIGGVGMG